MSGDGGGGDGVGGGGNGFCNDGDSDSDGGGDASGDHTHGEFSNRHSRAQIGPPREDPHIWQARMHVGVASSTHT